MAVALPVKVIEALQVSAEGHAPVQFGHALLPLTVSEQMTMQYSGVDADPTVSPQAPIPGPVYPWLHVSAA